MQATLFEIPRDENAWNRFSWSNRQSHARILAGIAARGGPNLPEYVLDIAQNDFGGFLERNAAAHTEMNAALGAQGSDLQDLDPNNESQVISWIYLHAMEHRTAEALIGVTS